MKKTKASKAASKSTSKTAKPAAAKSAKAAKPAAKPAKPVKAAPKKAAAKPAKAVAAKPVKKAAAKPQAAKGGAKDVAKVAVKAVGKAVLKAAAKLTAKSAKTPEAKPEVEAKAKAVKADKVEKKAAKPEAAKKAELRAPVVIPEEPDVAEEVILTDAEGRRYCRAKDCDRLAEVDAYCRYHYILLWKNIQTRRHILQEGKLGRYIEELTARYPDKFLEILKKDLRSEKDFLAAIQELEIDESAVEAEFDDEESQSDLFEIQRVSDTGSGDRSDSDDRF
ncbi:MAG: hypothetical protein RBT63_01745 [Bdellovibrionales bacterium]|jgi:hypothetical protein|nr:hypothetical protein [Bdellovibrionales bacterium]